MNLAIVQQPISEDIERVIVAGDLAKLTSEQRLSYYSATCRSLGLNPLTKPFEYISLNGKLVLYARRDATDQLRKVHVVSITIVAREKVDDIYVVTARATTPDGRTDESVGAVHLGKLTGEALANAFMKAETKAKRRVTLSICGLGFTDESEVDSIPTAQRVRVDQETGEILEPAKVLQPTKKQETHADKVTKEVIDREIEDITNAIDDAPSVDVLLSEVRPRMVSFFALATKLPKDIGDGLKKYFNERKTQLEVRT